MNHPAYRHLERPVHLGGLTLTQWAYLTSAAFAAFGLSRILPFSDTYNLSVATTIAGAPAAATLAGGMGETHLFAYVLALVRHRRAAAVHDPRSAPADPPAGYVLVAAGTPHAGVHFDPAELWSDRTGPGTPPRHLGACSAAAAPPRPPTCSPSTR